MTTINQSADNLRDAYNIGKQLAGTNLDDDNVWHDFAAANPELAKDMSIWPVEYSIMFGIGKSGNDYPAKVKGYRYGKLPDCGVSTNHVTNETESGISIIALDGDMDKVQDITKLTYRHRGDLIHIEGYLTPYLGSDGEPLLVYCKEID